MGAGSFPHSHYPLSIIHYPLPFHHLPHGHTLRNRDAKHIDAIGELADVQLVHVVINANQLAHLAVALHLLDIHGVDVQHARRRVRVNSDVVQITVNIRLL